MKFLEKNLTAPLTTAPTDLVSQIIEEDEVTEFVSGMCLSWVNLSKKDTIEVEDTDTF